jgi:hypothetical protein
LDNKGREELQYVEAEDNGTTSVGIAGLQEDISGEM